MYNPCNAYIMTYNISISSKTYLKKNVKDNVYIYTCNFLKILYSGVSVNKYENTAITDDTLFCRRMQ